MAIRKEQALLLVTVAFAYWMYTGIESVGRAKKPRATAKKYELAPGFEPLTVTASGPKNIRELFREPSESRPLPPREDLPFPQLGVMPVVLLPLAIGQQPPAYHGLRHAPLAKAAAPAKEDGEEPQAPQAAPAAAAPASPAAAGVTQDDPSLRYDTMVMADGTNNRFYGLFLGSEAKKFELASRPGPYDGETLVFQWIDPRTGKRQPVLKEDGGRVARLEIAKTLRNEVGMRLFRRKPTKTNLADQRDDLLYLLEKARIEPWVYEKALERADTYLQLATLKEEGLLYKARVLRAMGDLPGAYRLFRELDNDPRLKGSSFQLRGLGIIEAKLGLDRLAEAHLTRAVAINKPIDPRNYAALATFYLDRGRGREAVEPARQAVAFKTRRDPTPAEVVGFSEVLVRALLAVGAIEEAERHAAKQVTAELQRHADYQAACIAYARQDHATAADFFQKVYNTGRFPDALVGIAACQLATGDLGGGQTTLTRLVDEHPRLRHLGLAGLGLALSSGAGDDALERIDAGILTYPNHPYLLYLQGRQRRLNGDLEGAVEPLRKALRQHDDFLEALGELTLSYYGLYLRNQDANALVSALRYVDRLAELDQAQGGKADLFLDLQGKIHYEARDFRGARQAFEQGASNSRFCQIGLAMIAYTQKRQDLAEQGLQQLIRDLPQDDRFRKHAEYLLALMIRHSNKEQVIDRFDRAELGKAWKGGAVNSVKAAIDDGELVIRGQFGRRGNQPVTAPRFMMGPGRFLSLSTEMKIGPANRSSFAGVQVGIPGRGGGSSRFSLRVGMDDRERLVIELLDGRDKREPLRPAITVTKGDWHRILITVDDADDADPKDSSRYLRVFFDGQNVIPKEMSKLKTLRRTDSSANPFVTEYRVESNPLSQVDVAFRNYRRVQEKVK